jgi:dihydroxy-acid dehydratase
LSSKDESVASFYKAGPGGKRTISPYSQNMLWRELDLNQESGCVRSLEFAYSQEGGLAILFGNIAYNGCVVKTGAVPGQMLKFSGKAVVFDDQDNALSAIDGGKIEDGSVIVIRYEGPKGGPGMQEMLKPTMSMKAQGIEQTCAIITDGRYSGGSAGLAIGHISPEAAEEGNIGIIENGDIIEIDIPNRQINLLLANEEIEKRRQNKDIWLPNGNRSRVITKALRSYAAFASSADKGGYRDVP